MDGVAEVDVLADRRSGLADRRVGVQVDMLVLARSPDVVDEDVVATAALAVHADPSKQSNLDTIR